MPKNDVRLSKVKLSDSQKEFIKRMRNGGFYIKLHNECFWGGGCGGSANRGTIRSLKKKGLIEYNDRLTELGKTIPLD